MSSARLILLTAILTVAMAAPALATFPGQDGRIAFVQTDPPGQGGNELYSVLPDGTDVVQLTDTDAYEYAPSWSADGSRIVFERVATGQHGTTIYTMDADGQNPSVVTSVGGDSPGPSFSPDGTRVVYSTGRAIVTSDLGGAAVERVARKARGFGGLSDPEYSPDGGKIIFTGKPHARSGRAAKAGIWTVRVDGTHLRRLTGPNGAPNVTGPDYNPDGHQVTFTRSVPGHATSRIFVMNADGSDPRPIHPSGYEGSSFSPAGDRIVFNSIPTFVIGGCADVMTMTPTGSEEFPVTANCGGSGSGFEIAYDASWQPVVP
jgi:Tol biopolymer transport system component